MVPNNSIDVQAVLPTFLIIGAQKSGTRWLRTNLGSHPQIYAAEGEPSFFNSHRYFSGIESYARTFEQGRQFPVRGESTPGYMMWGHQTDLVPQRIHNTLPEVRLIALLRDPVERAYSAFKHHQRHGRIPSSEHFQEYVRKIPPENDPLKLIAGGWYAETLEPYLRLFGDALLVESHDCIDWEPAALYGRVLGHLQVSEDYRPPYLRAVLHSQQKNEKFNNRIVGPKERMELMPWFREDIRETERMFGLDLSHWKEG